MLHLYPCLMLMQAAPLIAAVAAGSNTLGSRCSSQKVRAKSSSAAGKLWNR